MNNKTDEQLKLDISRDELFAERGGYVVIFGLLTEVFSVFLFGHGPITVSTWGNVAANSIITLGVAAEVLFSRKARAKAERLQLRTDERLATALQRASSAEEELIRFRTPRREIMEGKWAAFSDKLKPFSGTEFDAGIGQGGEIMHFWWDMAHALQNAQWHHVPWIDQSQMYRVQGSLPRSGSVDAMNVEVHIHPNSRPALEPAANALIQALRDDGIVAVDVGFNVHSQNVNAVHITIGQKW